MWVGTDGGEDSGDVRTLESICDLHAEKPETQIPKFPETLVRLSSAHDSFLIN
jgi:hypothetical protein